MHAFLVLFHFTLQTAIDFLDMLLWPQAPVSPVCSCKVELQSLWRLGWLWIFWTNLPERFLQGWWICGKTWKLSTIGGWICLWWFWWLNGLVQTRCSPSVLFIVGIVFSLFESFGFSVVLQWLGVLELENGVGRFCPVAGSCMNCSWCCHMQHGKQKQKCDSQHAVINKQQKQFLSNLVKNHCSWPRMCQMIFWFTSFVMEKGHVVICENCWSCHIITLVDHTSNETENVAFAASLQVHQFQFVALHLWDLCVCVWECLKPCGGAVSRNWE